MEPNVGCAGVEHLSKSHSPGREGLAPWWVYLKTKHSLRSHPAGWVSTNGRNHAKSVAMEKKVFLTPNQSDFEPPKLIAGSQTLNPLSMC